MELIPLELRNDVALSEQLHGYTFLLKTDGRLNQVIWIFPTSRLIYRSLGDIVISKLCPEEMEM